MSNETEQLTTIQNPIVAHKVETSEEVHNLNNILQELVPLNSTESLQNNSNAIIIKNADENVALNAVCEVIDGKDMLGKEIMRVISSNIFCLENVKQEFSVTISNGTVEVSNTQFQCHQDLNLVYTEDYIPGGTTAIVAKNVQPQPGLNDVDVHRKYFTPAEKFRISHHTCDVCHKSFRKKSNLKRHYRSHTGDNPHICGECGSGFATRSRLKEHELTHTGLRPHKCDTCGKSFSRVSNLTRHLRTHSEEKPYQCDRCDGRFIEHARLQEHYLTHVGEKKFACDMCGKHFLKKFNLKRHRLTHTGNRPFACGNCGRGFSKKIYLLLHMETHEKEVSSGEADSAIETVASNCVVESDSVAYHDDSSGTNENQENKIFSCSECRRNYVKEQSLINHMRRHQRNGPGSTKRPLVCAVCNATFPHASRLREHLVSHSGAKLYACALCQRSFGRNSNLLRHLHTHTGDNRFACGVCGRRFGSNSRLKEHLTTHTGEMLYDCTVCGRNFRHSCGLQRHLMVHTGEKPHKCATCGKRFNRRGRLATHCKRHHSTSEPKFPNRVEPRLMNIIQNLEARVGSQGDSGEITAPNRMTRSCSKGKKYTDPDCETDESSEDLEDGTEKNNRKDGHKTKISKSKQKKTHSNHSSYELEELTINVTSANDEKQNPCIRTLSKRTVKSSTKKTKCTQSELKRRHSKEKSRFKSILHGSSLNSSPKRTNKDCSTVKSPGNIATVETVQNELELVEEQIEIEDASAYQTQVIGNDLDTIILIKAAS
ncbi:hypothetical protein JTE90_022877 [Oedothorax gibbosus]|uniref:C2H2-type domain-containing protein n=1 Tax=Oedothorax gibbosus TaxID=931172 RepID=A0AAV6UT13_9ARAC|nr:hypothetical protein JTE90_022877 [Oedothorax gibbosus]